MARSTPPEGDAKPGHSGSIGSLRVVDRRWLSRRALSLHVTLAIVVPGFLALTAWQVDRAVTGNTLSWVYSVEWPFFASYAVYLWWRLVHEEGAPRSTADVESGAADAPSPQGRVMVDEAARAPAWGAAEAGPAGGGVAETQAPQPIDDELEAYNRYLAALNESGRRKRW